MIYDFETLVSRKNTGSGKWDEMTKEHPNLPENVAPLSVADMELKNPPEIVEGLKKYIDTHILGYTGPTEEYFDAVCGWMKRRNDWNIKKEEIVSTHGVVTVLAVSVLAYTDPGDGVITMPHIMKRPARSLYSKQTATSIFSLRASAPAAPSPARRAI